MNKITLTEASHTDNKLSFSFDHPDSLDSVFNYSSIEFEYDVNISNIPDGVIYIPYVTNLAPISWAYDVDLVVPKLEYEFKIALDSVQETLDRFYPEMGIKESGSGIKANTIVDIGENENTNTASKTAQLFSGGLDSLTTYVRHHTEPLKLISINKHKMNIMGTGN